MSFPVPIPTSASERRSAPLLGNTSDFSAGQRSSAGGRPSGARGRAFESRRANSGTSSPASTSVEMGVAVPGPAPPPVSFPVTNPSRRTRSPNCSSVARVDTPPRSNGAASRPGGIDPLHHLIRLVTELARDGIDRDRRAGVQRLQPRVAGGVSEQPRPDLPPLPPRPLGQPIQQLRTSVSICSRPSTKAGKRRRPPRSSRGPTPLAIVDPFRGEPAEAELSPELAPPAYGVSGGSFRSSVPLGIRPEFT